MLGRNLLIDFHGGMQGARKWWILNDRNGMLVGDLPDLQGQCVYAFCDAYRSAHPTLIFEGDGVMRRVCDDARRLRDRCDNAAQTPDLPDLLHLALDRRVAFRLFEFFLQLPE